MAVDSVLLEQYTFAMTMTPSRARWAIALIVGTIGYLTVIFASQVVPSVLFGAELTGPVWAGIGLFQLIAGVGIVMLALRIVGYRLRDIGLTLRHLGSDAAIGAFVAVAFALVQFLVIIPATGGAERSDIVANTAQIGTTYAGLAGIIFLAWTGAVSEEVFFRGHFLNTIAQMLGGKRAATAVAAMATIVLFALLHGYQGIVGVIDTGLYGGLTLTLLYLWRRRLTACIVAHSLWNTIAAIVLFFVY